MASTDERTARARTPNIGVRDGVAAVGPPAFFLLAVLACWQAAVALADVPAVILPSPMQVGTTLIRSFPRLAADAAVTATTAALGLLAGVCLGIAAAFGMTYSRSVAAVVRPYLIALRIAPLIAVAPLLFLWIGDGIAARALLVTSMTVFPVAIAAHDGLRSVPPEYLSLAASVGASRRRTFLRVRVPAAAPSVFAGAKLAAALSVVGTVVAEFVVLDAGLGYRVFRSSTYLRTRLTFAALVVLALLGVAFYAVPALIERWLSWDA